MKRKFLASVDVIYNDGSLSLCDVNVCDIVMSNDFLNIPTREKGCFFAIPLDELKSLRIYKEGETEE